MSDGYYIVGKHNFWVIDNQEFTIDEARAYLATMGFDRGDIHQYMKSLRQRPIRLDDHAIQNV